MERAIGVVCGSAGGLTQGAIRTASKEIRVQNAQGHEVVRQELDQRAKDRRIRSPILGGEGDERMGETAAGGQLEE